VGLVEKLVLVQLQLVLCTLLRGKVPDDEHLESKK